MIAGEVFPADVVRELVFTVAAAAASLVISSLIAYWLMKRLPIAVWLKPIARVAVALTLGSLFTVCAVQGWHAWNRHQELAEATLAARGIDMTILSAQPVPAGMVEVQVWASRHGDSGFVVSSFVVPTPGGDELVSVAQWESRNASFSVDGNDCLLTIKGSVALQRDPDPEPEACTLIRTPLGHTVYLIRSGYGTSTAVMRLDDGLLIVPNLSLPGHPAVPISSLARLLDAFEPIDVDEIRLHRDDAILDKFGR